MGDFPQLCSITRVTRERLLCEFANNLDKCLMLWTHRPNFHWELTVTPQSGLIGIIDVNNPQYSLIMPYSCLIRFSDLNVLAVDKGSLKDI